MSEELIKRLEDLSEGCFPNGAARQTLQDAIAALSQQTEPVTVSVPTVPTDAMRDAGNEIIKNRSQLFQAWNAMLRAAQEGKK